MSARSRWAGEGEERSALPDHARKHYALGAEKGGNLESPGDPCGLADPSEQVNVAPEDLKLGPLRDNGVPTLDHASLSGSPVIDAVALEDCVDAEGMPLLAEERGVERPQGPRCDTAAV